MRRVLLFSFFAVCSPVFAQDAVFRGNPQHTGVYDGPGVPQFTKIKWQFHTEGQIFSSPAVSGGTLYVGSTDHFLYAVDLAAGTQKWKFKTGGRINSSPAVSGGLVYFGCYDGNFYAVDAATGKEKWKFKTEGERRFAAKHLHGASPDAETMPDPFDFYLSSPVVWHGAVYFGSGDTNVYALDASTGSLKWKFKTGEDEEIHNQVGIQSSAAVADGIVFFGCRDSKFYAVDAATGKHRWAFSNNKSWVISSPAVLDGKVYFATSDTGLFHALDAKTGTPVFSLDYKHWPMFSSPALAGGAAYIGSHSGKLLAIDLKTQKPAWMFETESSKKSPYVKPDGSPNYEAAYFDFFYDDMVAGGQKMLTVGAILSSPVVANGTIYVGSTDGNVYALI